MAFEYMYDIVYYFCEFSFTSFALIITVSILLHYVFFSNGCNPALPPSPGIKLPVLGHLHLLGHDMRKPLRKYHKQLGDVYSLYFGGRLGIVLAEYETLKEAFVKNGDLFEARPSLYMTDIATRNRDPINFTEALANSMDPDETARMRRLIWNHAGRKRTMLVFFSDGSFPVLGVILANGQRWKEHRRFALSTLKDFGMGKRKLEGKVHEEVKLFLSEIEHFKGEAFDPKDIISTHIANVICFMLFKGQFKHDDPRFLGMIKAIDENIELATGLANLIPWMAEFPGDPLKCKRMINNADKVYEYLEDIIDEHVREYDENDIDDLTSAYIKEMKRLASTNQATTMNLEQLSGLIGDLFLAGSHTTTAAIRWAIVCLVEFPAVQEKLYRAITVSIGDQRLPSLADKTSLGYLEAFYLEVLRYCNIAILSGMHATTRDMTFKRFTIPKHALLLPDLDSVFTDPDIWMDPENFRPERFLNEDGKIRKREEMVAFFLGKRSCIGESLARMELLLFIGSLVQRFCLESSPNETLSVKHVDGVFGLVHAPKKYNIVARPRFRI